MHQGIEVILLLSDDGPDLQIVDNGSSLTFTPTGDSVSVSVDDELDIITISVAEDSDISVTDNGTYYTFTV